MKHTWSATLFLVIFFLLSQIIGLTIVNFDAKVSESTSGEVIVAHPVTAIGERPALNPSISFWYITGAVLVGTGIVLLLVRFRKMNLWKFWFFLAVWLTMTVALGVFVNKIIAYAVCLFFAIWKVYRPNIYVHNLTELFMYAGIALIFIPLLNIMWAIILLLVISAYDMFAVWKSKHMIKMAEFQSESNVFAGLFLPYRLKKGKTKISARMAKIKADKKPSPKEKGRAAILGGGDIAFPMIFSGVIMENLIRVQHITKLYALLEALIISVFVTIALFILLIKSEKGKYYPAMPFITLGCLVGYGVVWLINFLI